MVGGFGLCGNPEKLIQTVAEMDISDLTLISNNAGNLNKGLALWLKAGIVKKVICSYVGNNEDLHSLMETGKIEVEIVPQGTFAERIRCAGAGIPAFFTPTGAGTVVAKGKETRLFSGIAHILEEALHADFALIRAAQVDTMGNLRFHRTTRNFQLAMATAAQTTIVEADVEVPLGTVDPDDVHLPGIFVHRYVHVPQHENPIEYLTTQPPKATS